MKFQPGRQKTGGRVKGKISEKTLILHEIFNSGNYDPAKKLLELLPSLEPRDQAKVHLELMQYIYPKLKEPLEPEMKEVKPLEERSLEELKQLKISLTTGSQEIDRLIDAKQSS